MSRVPINGPANLGMMGFSPGKKEGRGGRPLWRGFLELDDQSSHRPNWSSGSATSIQDRTCNKWSGQKTETCLVIDVINQHARRRRRLPQLYYPLQVIPDYLYLADVFMFMSCSIFHAGQSVVVSSLAARHVCSVYGTSPPCHPCGHTGPSLVTLTSRFRRG